MPIQFLSGTTYGPYSGDVPDQITVDAGATVHATTAGTAGLTLGSGPWEAVFLNGKVTADDGHAVNLKTAGMFNSSVIVGPDAQVSGGGSSGIGIAAAHATGVTNSGSIKGGSTGILESGDGDFYIYNNGTIEGAGHGIGIWGLGRHQVITGGTVTGGTYAIFGSSGEEWVANIGTLQGKVHLGDGDDILANFVEESGQRYDGRVTDVVDLGKGNDQFFGGKYTDLVRDGDGKDEISFGAGDDMWFGFLAGGDDGADTVAGGAGTDTYDAGQSGVQGVGINLDTVAHGEYAALVADDRNGTTAAESISGFENAFGTNFADFLYGAASKNVLIGRDGDDTMFAFAGDDVLNGGAGLDTLTGGGGKDVLLGGADRDIFDFNSIKEALVGAKRDVISDFQRGTNVTGDDIDLFTIDARTGVAGNQAFKFIGTQNFHGLKGELHYKDLGATCLVQGDVNGDGKADFEILVKAAALSGSDFIL